MTGILVNVCPLHAIVSVLNILLPTIAQCLDWSPFAFFTQSNVISFRFTFLPLEDMIHEKDPAFQEWEMRVNSQIMSLEVLGNIVANHYNEGGLFFHSLFVGFYKLNINQKSYQ